MSYEVLVTYTGDYVEVHSIGDKNYHTAVMLWTEVTKVCRENNCYKVLGIGKSTTAMPIVDSVKHAKLLKDFEVTHKYKIAWVELNKEAISNVKFLETYLLNRGLVNGRFFYAVEEAKSWLLQG